MHRRPTPIKEGSPTGAEKRHIERKKKVEKLRRAHPSLLNDKVGGSLRERYQSANSTNCFQVPANAITNAPAGLFATSSLNSCQRRCHYYAQVPPANQT